MNTIIATQQDAGVRLDRFVRKRLPLTKLSGVYRLIRQGKIRVNGRKSSESRRLVMNDTVEIECAPAEIAGTADQPPHDKIIRLVNTEYFKRNFAVLFEDELLIACNKPANLVVHPGSGHLELDTLIDLVKSYIWNKRTRKCPLAEPQLVHRLDRDTSGVILLSKDMHTLRALHDSLRRGAIHKHYRAICHSSPPQRSATIETALARSYERGAGTRVMVAEKGLPSRTSYTVLRTRNHLSDLRLDLHTGRTHQIRVQLAHIGCPIAGDTRYGSPELDQRIFTRTAAAQRLYLHAERLSFPHPATKETIVVAAPIPREFEILMQQAARRE